MSDRLWISRRAFTAGAVALGIGPSAARAQGFVGLGKNAEVRADVVPAKIFSFPDDHGPHPDYRIEWWYVTANLVDSTGAALGLQWTLFRQAVTSGAQRERWGNQ